MKADSKVIRDWFKTVDFDGDGYMDYHGWSKILDDHVKLGGMFKVMIGAMLKLCVRSDK